MIRFEHLTFVDAYNAVMNVLLAWWPGWSA